MSYVPAIRRAMINFGVTETEDLMQECLLGIIEILNQDNYSFGGIFRKINYVIYNYILRDTILSGTEEGKLSLGWHVSKITDVLDNSVESVPYQDFYDESDIDLETYVINKCFVGNILQCLTPRELGIVKLYYYQRCTFEEIGKVFNLTRGRVHAIMQRILFKLKGAAYLANKCSEISCCQESKNTSELSR